MPDLFDERIAMARRLADQRQFADAIIAFNWLCDSYPDRAAAFVDSADTFARVYDYTGVAARFAQIEARPHVPGPVWLAMAQISERLRRPAWARRFLSRAIDIPASSAEACGLFSLYLEHANDLNAAAELYQRGLKIDAADPSCKLAMVRILRRRKEYEAADRAVHELLKSSNASVPQQISARYELAHISDATGNFPGAMRALIEAKRLTTTLPDFKTVSQRSQQAERTHHRFLTSADEVYFKAAQSWEPKSPRRMALLAGHPRSGTTLLEQILDSHSGIISAEETLLFSNAVNDPFVRDLADGNICQAAMTIPTDRLETMREVYFATMENLLDQPIGDRLLIDKNPSCTDNIPVFARVFPEATFIVALRDPRDVMLSCFFQDFPLNPVTVNFLSLHDTAVRYANTMAMWLLCRENLDERKWTEVRYESLVTDVRGESEKVMMKLNLPWQATQASPELHARERGVQSPSYAAVTNPVHTKAIGRWKNYESLIAETYPILSTFLEAFDYSG